ncbi:MAG: branched-chain amino acid ABC transporter permease, partial [Tissierellia bacterium]|nr:branched-chain amino acid ABC transporter permease [Tissierellia bacterium]
DESITIGNLHIEGVQGMRMVVFSIILMLVVIIRKEGLIKES